MLYRAVLEYAGYTQQALQSFEDGGELREGGDWSQVDVKLMSLALGQTSSEWVEHGGLLR